MAFIAIGVILALFAGLRLAGLGPDYYNYKAFYDGNLLLRDFFADPATLFLKDPGYFLITSFLKFNLGFSFNQFLVLFAFICVGIKVWGINKISNSPYYSLWIYFSFFYFLHEMITIRAGASAAMFLFAIPYLKEKKYVKYLSIIGVAILFHYSALVLLPFVLLPAEAKHPRWYLAMLLLSIVGASLGVTLDVIIFKLPPNMFTNSLIFYQISNLENPIVLNVFSRISIPNLVVCIYLLLNFDKIKDRTPYASLIIRIFCLAQVLFFSLSGFAVIAGRVSELVGIVGILAWPLLLYLVKPGWRSTAIFGSAGVIFLSMALRILWGFG